MINKVLAYLSGLSDQGQAPPVFSTPAPQAPKVQHAATVAPCMDASLEIGTFPRLTTGPIMTNDQHELFSKFLKLKPPMWWWSHVKCQPTEAPPMTWASFSSLFMDKYIPRTLKDRKRDEFLSLEQGRMSVTAYEAKFRALSQYATQLCFSPQEHIRRFVKGLR